MKIRFQGPINVIKQDEDGENEELITSPELLKKLDGRSDDNEVADYMFDGPGTENLEPLNITGGIFGLLLKDNKIYMHIDYYVEKKPDEKQIETLWEYTQGQMSDGAGPIFSGDCEDETGLYPILEIENIELVINENT